MLRCCVGPVALVLAGIQSQEVLSIQTWDWVSRKPHLQGRCSPLFQLGSECNVNAIQQMRLPITVNKVRTFLVLEGYCQHFMKHYVNWSAPWKAYTEGGATAGNSCLKSAADVRSCASLFLLLPSILVNNQHQSSCLGGCTGQKAVPTPVKDYMQLKGTLQTSAPFQFFSSMFWQITIFWCISKKQNLTLWRNVG